MNQTKSILSAIKEQGLLPLYWTLSRIVLDITHQYSSFDVDTDYLRTKIRGQHAFQISLVNEAIYLLGMPKSITDVGDSAGTHIQYIKGLYPDKDIQTLSVNSEQCAVDRIRSKGLDAVCCRAEDLYIKADMFLCFEMLEHLMNPCEFLYKLSKIGCRALVLTIPYLRQSRVGLHHIRGNQKRQVNSENTHIFELSPGDWGLIFKHSGWRVLSDKIYLQYPRKSMLAPYRRRCWRLADFEGFYGIILIPDNRRSVLYNGR